MIRANQSLVQDYMNGKLIHAAEVAPQNVTGDIVAVANEENLQLDGAQHRFKTLVETLVTNSLA
eukprot:8268328-Prorocentrum_lima.AAC.1